MPKHVQLGNSRTWQDASAPWHQDQEMKQKAAVRLCTEAGAAMLLPHAVKLQDRSQSLVGAV